MPYIDLMVHPELTPTQAERLAEGITDAMCEIMGKRREVTVVRVARADCLNWSIGGRPSARATAYLDVKITEGSNGQEEKARLIGHLDRLLRDTLGDLAEASYVVIHELPADNWGYAGTTQAARRMQRASTGEAVL